MAGAVARLAIFDVGRFWLGVVAVILLLMVNYLLARVLATLIEWLAHVRGGTAILFLLLMSVAILPSILIPRLVKAHGAREAMLAMLHYTPTFAAAAITVNTGANLPYQFSLMAVWIAVLLFLLAIIEKQAARPRSAVAAAVAWDDRYERIASIFGPSMAPLVGRTLRYYVRSNKVRFNYIAAVPLMAFLTFNRSVEGGGLHYFVRGLGAFAIVGFLGTAVMATNQFGFDSSGFRRYFLLPLIRARSCVLRVIPRCSWEARWWRYRAWHGCCSRRSRPIRASRPCCWQPASADCACSTGYPSGLRCWRRALPVLKPRSAINSR